MTLNILVACQELRTPGGLEHVRGDAIRIVHSTLPGWATAANVLLENATAAGGDVLFLDDDTALTPGCLDAVRTYYDDADIFGLDLHDLRGVRQVGARHTINNNCQLADWVEPGPVYVAHVSTSAVYITAAVLVAGVRFPTWPGVHYEDVAFCLEAWLEGFRVLAVPGRVDHAIEGGVGATKRYTPDFWNRLQTNQRAFATWCAEHDVARAIRDGRIPSTARDVDRLV